MAKSKDLEKIIKDAVYIGIANPIKIRNIEIRQKFRDMREKEFIKYDDALVALAQEYFLSISSIQQIITGYKNKEY
jgi:hypothetical protein